METGEAKSVDLDRRYRDAYRNADSINNTGQTLKRLGFVFALLIVLGSFIVSTDYGGQVLFIGIFSAILVLLPFYALGIIVAAQGQMLKAILDTAVNTSPLLSKEELVEILAEAKASQGGAQWVLCSTCHRQFLSTNATMQGDSWFCSEHAPAEGA